VNEHQIYLGPIAWFVI